MIKKTTIFLLSMIVVFFISIPAIAQEDDTNTGTDDNTGFDITNPFEQKNQLAGGLGLNLLGDQTMVGFRFQPEISLWKIGVGLDVPLMYNVTSGKLYLDEFQDGVGLLRMVRYFRYGVKKKDAVYVKVGDISGAYLGYGLLLDDYTNASSYQKRKIGVEADICIGKVFGTEIIYSDFDFTSLNLLAIRPYVKPFGRTGIPIIKTYDIGFSYIIDKDNTSMKTDSGLVKTNNFVKDGFSAWGADMGITIINWRWIMLRAYAQYGHLNKVKSDELQSFFNTPGVLNPADSAFMVKYDAANGIAVGANFRFKFLGNLLKVNARIERIWYDDYFQPQFFDGYYDLNKDNKVLSLANTQKKAGIYASTYVSVLDKILVGGGIMLPDEVTASAPAMVKLDLDASKLFDKIVLTSTYYKAGITDLNDALKVDDRALVDTKVAYKVWKFLAVGVNYRWKPAEMKKEGIFKSANDFFPYVGFNMPLNFGKKEQPEEDEDE